MHKLFALNLATLFPLHVLGVKKSLPGTWFQAINLQSSHEIYLLAYTGGPFVLLFLNLYVVFSIDVSNFQKIFPDTVSRSMHNNYIMH